MLPTPALDQVTEVLSVFATTAVNCWDCPVWSVIEEGATITDTGRGSFTVTTALAELLAFTTDVAVTDAMPANRVAVKMPSPLILPFFADHVTRWSDVPLTVARNCCVWPTKIVALLGETVTLTDSVPGFVDDIPAKMPQPRFKLHNRMKNKVLPNLHMTRS